MARQDAQKETAKAQGKGQAKDSATSREIRPESPLAVQKALKGIHYPASKSDLLKQAQQNSAPDMVLTRIRSMHGDRFEKPTDVMKALGKKE